jgi:predicted aldo/keto reductase-like oxidoreductase
LTFKFRPVIVELVANIWRDLEGHNMENMVTIGHTGISVQKNGFGALPIQRIPKEDAVKLLHRAYEAGINYYDTARAYTDSEEKLGTAFEGIRDKIVIATKTAAQTGKELERDLEQSLKMLRTDYIDIYQFHNPAFCPKPGDGTGLYEAAAQAVKDGKIRHIGITNHRLNVAEEAVSSGLYETLQFPFCYLAAEPDLKLVEKCGKAGMGFFAMKALSGGLITNARAAYAFEAEYPFVVPLWGVQKETELDDFISFIRNPPVMDAELRAVIEKDRKELSGDFCRGCGYCMPCPAGIEINNCARMSLLLRRSPTAEHLMPETQKKMEKIEECRHCNQCRAKCPYGLDTPALLRKNLEDYRKVLANGGL